MAAMNLAGFLKSGGMEEKPSIPGSDWATQVILPQIRNWDDGAGRVIDPNMLPPQAPQVPRMFNQPSTLADTGFADFLRNHYLPQLGR